MRLLPLLLVVALLTALPALAQAQSFSWRDLISFLDTLRRRSCLSTAPLVAVLSGTTNSTCRGAVMFSPLYTRGLCAVLVRARVAGLAPGAAHGFHIHRFGDLRMPDGTGTGGHFNPTNASHALPAAGLFRHRGDMGNLRADARGVAAYSRRDRILRLPAIVGRGLIVHARPDDGGQPTGNAGSRICQGVIGYARVDY